MKAKGKKCPGTAAPESGRLPAKTKQMSESLPVGLALAIVGGYLDAYTFIARGGVFANAQTGNIVLLGMELAARQWRAALYYLMPILAFTAGIAVAEAVKVKYKQGSQIHWRQVIIIVETLILLAVMLIPQGTYDVAANIAISFVCSLQVQAFRKVNGNAYATTMCTGNLRSATEQLFVYTRGKDSQALKKSLQYYSVIGAFIGGAAIGCLATGIFGAYAVGFPCILLMAAFLIMFRS